MKFKYSSGIAPLVTTKEYNDLIEAYKKEGPSVFPHIMKLGGMAIDTSQNRNKWRVPLTDLYEVAKQLHGAPLMKDHDIDHVDSIIGKVEEAWVEEDGQGGGKVVWKGETSDESLIQKILLGYVKNNSIQIAVPQAYCDNCITHLGKTEEEASLDNLDFPCPRCGSLEMVARHPAVLEQSLVAIPAYEKADITPFGFKAAFDNFQEKRIENAQKAGWKLEEVKTPMPRSSAPDLTPLVISAFNTVTEVEIAVLETQARLLQGELEEALPGQTGRKAKPGLEHIVERMGGPEEWTPEDVIDEGKAEVMGGQDKCATCGHAEWYHQTDGCHAPTSYFPGAADCPCTVFAAKTEEAEVEDGDECSMCGGPLVELGSLGSVTHYRCRNCGMDFSKPSKGEAGGYACRDCGKTFGSLQSARNAAINGCPDCGCGNIDPSDSSEAGGYACRDCGKTFGSLQSARNAAINGCPDCGCGNIDPSDSKSEAGGAVADFPLAER